METPEKESRHIIVVGEVGIGLTESHRAYREAIEAMKCYSNNIEIIGIGAECVDRLSESAKNAEAVVVRAAEAMRDLSQSTMPTPPKMTVGKYETLPKKPKSKTKGWQRPYKYHR